MRDASPKGSEKTIELVLFDLDDTLFDHSLSSRVAFERVQAAHTELASVPTEELFALNARLLDGLHPLVLLGELTKEESRARRFGSLVAAFVPAAPEALAERVASDYRAAYLESMSPAPGALELLARLREHAKVGIVTNNLVEEQLGKLRACRLEPLIDVLVISEEAGVAKPHARVFEIALERAGCEAEATVMVGDSWENDVLGARGAGIWPVWLNRLGASAPMPSVADQIAGFEPLDEVAELLLRHA